jgi:hypothetical protein
MHKLLFLSHCIGKLNETKFNVEDHGGVISNTTRSEVCKNPKRKAKLMRIS